MRNSPLPLQEAADPLAELAAEYPEIATRFNEARSDYGKAFTVRRPDEKPPRGRRSTDGRRTQGQRTDARKTASGLGRVLA